MAAAVDPINDQIVTIMKLVGEPARDDASDDWPDVAIVLDPCQEASSMSVSGSRLRLPTILAPDRQSNAVPSIHMRRRIKARLRATATIADIMLDR